MNQIISKLSGIEELKKTPYPAPVSRTSNVLYLKQPAVVLRDGRYARYDNGVICDCYSALEWLCGPDKDTSWIAAQQWVEQLTVGGGGWRLPGIEELKGLYKKNKDADLLSPLFKRGPGDVWSMDFVNDAEVLGFNFVPGNQFRTYKTVKRRFRAMAVRPRQQYRGKRELKIVRRES